MGQVVMIKIALQSLDVAVDWHEVVIYTLYIRLLGELQHKCWTNTSSKTGTYTHRPTHTEIE